MKFPIVAIALILIAGAAIGFRQETRRERLEERHAQLVRQARVLGMALAEDGKPNRSGRDRSVSRSTRAEVTVDLPDLVARLSEMATRMEEMQMSGQISPSEELQQEVLELLGSVSSLSAEKMIELLDELERQPDSTRMARRQLVMMTLALLSSKDPRLALERIRGGGESDSDTAMMHLEIMGSAFTALASSDLNEAQEWLDSQHGIDERQRRELQSALIGQAAKQDPRQAIELIKGAPEHDPELLGRMVETAAERSAMLAAVREQNDPQLTTAVLIGMGPGLLGSGFEKASSWLQEQQLGDAEIQDLFTRVSRNGEDTGKWLEWMESAEVDPDWAKTRTDAWMSDWAMNDHQSSLKWLKETKLKLVARENAVHAYVRTAASYQPELAAEVLQDLPQGPQRRELANQIYSTYQSKNPAKSAEFAIKEGIKDAGNSGN